jgi:hypothetical protein
MHGGAAGTPAKAESLSVCSQLPRRHGPRAENTQDQRGKDRRFDLLIHGRFPSLVRIGQWPGYFAGLCGLAAMKLHVPESGKLGC